MRFVVAILVAAASIPPDVAFQVFIGTTNLVGCVSEAFITGIHSALMVSPAILAVAVVMFWIGGRAYGPRKGSSLGSPAMGNEVRSPALDFLV